VAQIPPDVTPDPAREPAAGQRLDSWKEIAAYLKRDVATARRWEKREALPVHRHHHEKLGSVYAHTSELDAWWEARRQQVEQHPPAAAGGWAGRRIVLPAVLLTLALAAAAAAYVWMARRATPASVGRAVTTLAVLPFQPLGGTARDEALELGMTDALITRLENVRQIRVRPTSAVLRYADAQPELEAAGRELRVDAVVEGKVQRSGDRIRVTVHLLRVRDGASLRAWTFEEQFTNIFAVQDSISQQIASALPLMLSSDEAKSLRKRDTNNAEAYQLYLKGRYFSSQRGEDALRKAVGYFAQAIKLDPAYALAYAGLADSYASWANSTVVPSREAYLKAKAAALSSIELDGRLADAHTTLGVVSLFYDWDWPVAERAFKRAIALEPEDARAHRRYAVGLMWMGRFDEAIREAERARQLAPVDPEINHNVALLLYFARRYDEAILEARKTLEMDSHFSQAHRTLGRALVEERRYDQAIAAFHQAIASGGVQLLKAELGHAYAVSGRTREARRMLGELRQLASKRYVSPYDMAILHVGLGEKDQAFDWLEKSYAERERWMVTLKVAPALDPLRSDPRFADLVRRVGLWQ
jgi:TolB-like protein/Flp pilus assembly protein TadD